MQPSRMIAFAGILLASLTAFAQLPKPETKGVTCGRCHRPEAMAQGASEMAHALQLTSLSSVLVDHPWLVFHHGSLTYSVQTHAGKSLYSVTDGTQTITVPITYAMGVQAQTWVLEWNGQLYESLVSYYPQINGLGITTGDEKIDPKNLNEAVGRLISKDEAKTCFNCHATHAIVDHHLSLSTMSPGVGCERCHVGSDLHLKAMLTEAKDDLAPARIGEPTTEDMSNFCGQCHRTWETVVRSHWHGEADVRFQPYRLANSRCYNGVDPRISCVACHNPHAKLERNTADYDPKCLACHGAAAISAAALKPSDPQPKMCPVAKSNCASCHMPKVSLPNGLMKLTDHQIRIVRANDPYPN